MKKSLLVVAFLAALVAPAFAKTFAVPTSNPVATLAIPDSWKTETITYGYSAKSPDGDVFFSVEFADAKRLPQMMKSNDEWMKENKIVPTGKATEREFDLGGLPASLVSYPAKDENGPTQVDFVFIKAGSDRVIMLTLWASEEEQKANQADIAAIKSSIKAIK